MKVDIAHLSRPKAGERFNGDRAVVRWDGRRHLLGLIDALGHGRHAAEVAEIAAAALEAVSLDQQPGAIMETLDTELRGSRGAAALICLIDPIHAIGCGVGNVALRSEQTDFHPLLTPGIIGQGHRPFARRPRSFEGELRLGSRLVMFSDGISARFSLSDMRTYTPAETCRVLLERYGRSHDDATVIVVDIVAADGAEGAAT